MTATTTQTKPTAAAKPEEDASYTAAALAYTQGLYETGKEAVLARTDAEMVKDAFAKAEEITKAGADHIVANHAETLAKVVATVDEKVDVVVKAAEPHVPVVKKTVEDTLQTADEYKTKVQTAYADTVKTVEENKAKIFETVSTTVETVRKSVDETIDQVLSKGESILDAALPPAKDAEEEKDEKTTEPAARVIRIRDVASKRFKKRALSGLESLSLRTKEIVPVNLLAYAELLDLELVKSKFDGKSTELKEKLDVARGQAYDLVTAEYTARIAVPTKKLTEAAAGIYIEQVQPKVDDVQAKLTKLKEEATEKAVVNIVAPARDYYAIAVAAFVKIKASEEPIVTGSEYVNQVKAAIGAAWDEKLQKPTVQLYQTLTTEWAKVVEEVEGDAPAEGVDQIKRLEKYVAAVRTRLFALFESYKPKDDTAEAEFVDAVAAAE